MRYRFEFRPYRRPFSQSLQTHHGLWSVREGILLRLTDAARQVAWGEIAPLSWFGSESLVEAIAFCQSLPASITPETVLTIPPHLPACQFGFESAWENLTTPQPILSRVLTNSHLLPTGTAALTVAPTLQPATYKWKIGVAPLQQELEQFEQLVQALPDRCQLRLDANGGLTWHEACQWLETCDRAGVEFLEQPLPTDQLPAMLKLSDQYATPIALDESIATIDQLQACYHQGWRGIFVIKAAIAGSPQQLREFCQQHCPDVVWSSVFETAIAQDFIKTRLIPSLPASTRAIGFGVNHWFTDGWERLEGEQLWQTL
jgi:o-succinylbenzoate synthase